MEHLILLTTSRRPTKTIRTFCKDLSCTIPNVLRINRGKLSQEGVAEKALKLNAEKVIVVDRWKGGPGKIQLFKISEEGLKLTPPLIYLRGVKLQREFSTMPRGARIRHLTILASSNLSNKDILKFENALSEFLNVPLTSIEESPKTHGALMHAKAEKQGFMTVTFNLVPDMVEIGPRMEISRLIWEISHEG